MNSVTFNLTIIVDIFLKRLKTAVNEMSPENIEPVVLALIEMKSEFKNKDLDVQYQVNFGN